MDEAKRKRSEAAGWTFGDYGDFLGLTEAERRRVELEAALSGAIKRLRQERGLTPEALAARIGVTPSRIIKIETSPRGSLNVMFKAFFAVGGRLDDLAPDRAVAPVS